MNNRILASMLDGILDLQPEEIETERRDEEEEEEEEQSKRRIEVNQQFFKG